MKKIVRLTESDLVSLIKKVLNEQKITYTPINPPIGIKASVKEKNGVQSYSNITITHKTPNMLGYFLRWNIPGRNSRDVLVYSCYHRNKLFIGDNESSFGGSDLDTIQTKTHREFVNITQQGDNLLYNKLGCGSFVLNNNNSSDDYLV